MVLMAWSGLASAFAPLLIFLCLGRCPSERVSIIAVIVGFVVALVWRQLGLHGMLYEGLPGMLAGFIVLFSFGFKSHTNESDDALNEQLK